MRASLGLGAALNGDVVFPLQPLESQKLLRPKDENHAAFLSSGAGIV